jgi:hypothetical protein
MLFSWTITGCIVRRYEQGEDVNGFDGSCVHRIGEGESYTFCGYDTTDSVMDLVSVDSRLKKYNG